MSPGLATVALAALALPLLRAQDFQEEGIKALEAKQYPAAIAAFEKAAAADAKDYSAYFHLGLAHSMAGHNAEAVAGYRKALELKPGLYEAELNLALVLIDLKQHAEAAALLKSAVEKKPKEFRPNYYWGEALLRSNPPQAEAAAAAFRAALEADTKSAEARAGLGRALSAQGKLKDAEAELRQAGDADALLELAARYEQARDPGGAIGIYQSFAATPNAPPGVGERLGMLLLESGKPAEAIAHLEAAVKQSPTGANRFALATAYLRDKQTDKATAMMEQAIAADNKNPELYVAYAGLLRDQKNFQGAAQQFWKAAQLKPDSREAWAGMATMLLSLENYAQSIAAFDKLESLGGEPSPGIYFLRALAYDKTQQYKPAQANYQKFLSLSNQKHPDEEFKARQRLKVIEKELARR